ncbi:Thioredoxin domain-containing protein 5 [Lamellibrachia satsuma]|nr:Thioredoxin domain-containing protein 5 [Lamellibrachia satsuma]
MIGVSVIFLLVLSPFVARCADEEESPVRVYDQETFDTELTKNPHFIKFYAPWCGHCKALVPTWDLLGKKYNVDLKQDVVTIAKVDCTVNTELCSTQGITGYPTLKFYQPGQDQDKAERFRGQRDIDGLTKFVQDQLGEPEAKEEDADVAASEPVEGMYVLKDKTFDKHIEKGSHFIKFFAPWCGHCKNLAPAWADLAKGFADNGHVTIAKVDCTEDHEVCSKQGVKGYPTLMWFSGGQMIEKYSGSRNLESLEDFVVQKLAVVDTKEEGTDGKIPDGKKTEIKSEGSVLIGTADNFADIVAEDTTFVKFFAPWCGHCKNLAPTWKELADAYAANPRIKVAKVDCTEHSAICQKHEVSGYPTLLLFINGVKKAEHEGGRGLESLQTFIKEHHDHDEL